MQELLQLYPIENSYWNIPVEELDNKNWDPFYLDSIPIRIMNKNGFVEFAGYAKENINFNYSDNGVMGNEVDYYDKLVSSVDTLNKYLSSIQEKVILKTLRTYKFQNMTLG